MVVGSNPWASINAGGDFAEQLADLAFQTGARPASRV